MRRRYIANNADRMQLKNQISILQYMQRGGCITRTQLAEYTGLTQAAVSKITAQLISWGIIEETAMLSGRKGRRSIGLSIIEDGYKVIGVKLSRRNYAVGVFSFSGNIIQKTQNNINIELSDEEVFSQIQEIVLNYIKTHENIVAVGIAVPGPYLMREKEILLISELDNKARRNISLNSLFSREKFENIPIIISHDANAGALADWWFDIEKIDLKGVVVHFLVGEGVGAGVINNGVVFAGSCGVAAEIGHVSIDHEGPLCVCGNNGCLEMYCSSLAFIRYAEEHRRTNKNSKLNNETRLSADLIFSLAKEGDEIAMECVKNAAYFIALGCVNIINCYNPDTIIICNEMAKGGAMLLEIVKENVKKRVLSTLYEKVDIVISSFKGDDILFGAAAVAIDYCLKRPNILKKTTIFGEKSYAKNIEAI